MYGPGRYVPDPTEGIVNVNDLPAGLFSFRIRVAKLPQNEVKGFSPDGLA